MKERSSASFDLVQDLDTYPCDTFEPYRHRSGPAEIDSAAFDERPAIINSHDNTPLPSTHTDFCAEPEGAVGCCEIVLVEAFSAGCPFSVKSGSVPACDGIRG